MADNSHVLVTGGAGFIGRRLVAALLEAGTRVTVVDHHPVPTSDVTTVTGDIRDSAVLDRAVAKGIDAIVHLAAVTSVVQSVQDPVSAYQVNVAATADLLEFARVREVGSFLLASTNAVVGDTSGAVISERSMLRPLSPYGATKAADEMLLSSYTASYGITGCALRLTNVYGPGMHAKDSFVPRLMRAAREGRGVEVRGDGTMLRDLVHVDDVVAGILAAYKASYTGPLILGSGDSVTVSEMVETARTVTGASLPVTHVPVGPAEMRAVVVDISAARSIGYDPRHDLKSGLATVWPDFAEAT